MPDTTDKDPPLLHVYGQGAWHDTVYVVGNRDALTLLRDALNRVLENGGWDEAEVCANDGEGYGVAVCLHEVSWADFHLVNQYIETDLTGPADEGDKPWMMFHDWRKAQKAAVPDTASAD